MIRTAWHFDESDGELQLRTGVAGRAARMGHRLTIAMTAWRGTVSLVDGEPTAADLTVDVSSFKVLRGEGGLQPISGAERSIVRTNALKSLHVKRFPHIHFRASKVHSVGDGDYRLSGLLEIHGKPQERVIDLRVDDLGSAWRLFGEADVRQSDFGIKPYSLLAGTLKVADSVTVSIAVNRAKEEPKE
ncbi:YceI family protein [Antrihabitans sp. YC2-6]|uniref:YceI family protein n=1 Tax=Antrihabitans sp. YC2-6 TaxID=2799498 RepID=UPI0018F62655|nr:YceI family protein [Antrihabitans sp. YC2-6]MBJ8347169.1 YceI family protein [Antrihabitans sp. YC2-6]